MRAVPLALSVSVLVCTLVSAASAESTPEPRLETVGGNSSMNTVRMRRNAAKAAVRRYLAEAAPEETMMRDVALSEHVNAASTSSGGVLGWVDLRMMAWYPALDGHIQDGNDRLDVQELGLDDSELAVMPQLHLSAGGIGVRVDAFFFEVEGNERVTRDFEFGGVNFTLDEDVRTELRIDNFRLIMILPIVKTKAFTLWLQGGISYFRFDAEVESDIASGEDDGDLPIPLGGVLVQARVWKLIVELDVSGFAIEYGSDLEGTALDVQISVGFVFAKVVSVRAGYRIVTVDGRFEDFDVDITLDGFFLGGSLNF